MQLDGVGGWLNEMIGELEFNSGMDGGNRYELFIISIEPQFSSSHSLYSLRSLAIWVLLFNPRKYILEIPFVLCGWFHSITITTIIIIIISLGIRLPMGGWVIKLSIAGDFVCDSTAIIHSQPMPPPRLIYENSL